MKASRNSPSKQIHLAEKNDTHAPGQGPDGRRLDAPAGFHSFVDLNAYAPKGVWLTPSLYQLNDWFPGEGHLRLQKLNQLTGDKRQTYLKAMWEFGMTKEDVILIPPRMVPPL